MYRILLFLCLIASVNISYAEVITTQSPYFYPNNNYYRRHNQNSYRYNSPQYNHYTHPLSKNDLSALEKYALNKVYSRDSDIKRLERLESLAFGSVQEGNIIARYKNVENAILNSNKNDYRKRSILNSIGNYFAGQTTGYTPNIYSSNYNQNFLPSYSTNRIDQYSGGMFGNAFRTMENSFGSGSGVRIMY